MDLKLHPNAIESVKYRLNNARVATLYFDINGCLFDVEVESLKAKPSYFCEQSSKPKNDCCNNPKCTPEDVE